MFRRSLPDQAISSEETEHISKLAAKVLTSVSAYPQRLEVLLLHFDTALAEGRVLEALDSVDKYIELCKELRMQKPLQDGALDEDLVSALYSQYSLTKRVGMKQRCLEAYREINRLMRGFKFDGNTSQEMIRVHIEIQEGRSEMSDLERELEGSTDR